MVKELFIKLSLPILAISLAIYFGFLCDAANSEESIFKLSTFIHEDSIYKLVDNRLGMT